ncbi:hypothetical protein PMAYCL1PPCAC_17829, partial [Pristionchus mayeri]
MLYRTVTNPLRHTNQSWRRGRSNCSVDTSRNMRRDKHSTASQSNREDRSRSPINNSSFPSSSTSSSDHYSKPDTNTNTVFRRAFKYYKKRDPRPDLSEVIEPRLMEGRMIDNCSSVTNDSFSSLGLRPLSEWKVITFPDRVGLYLLPDLLTPSGHSEWIRHGLEYSMDGNNKTNIALHSDEPLVLFLRLLSYCFDSTLKLIPFSLTVQSDFRSLRWTTLGIHYDWATKEYPSSGHPLPSELSSLASIVVSALGLQEIKADTTIVNYYPPKSTLSPHVDRSERTHRIPLVSLSVGRPAIYLTGGRSLDDPVLPILLQSGDVLVMDGDQRLVYHAVPAILPPGERKGPLEEEREREE